eukprot:GHVT01051822.1.p3 GENE.GHVT01051822.1~~GHVT01051822.1.p3  ORF type:complete len:109 (-),score=9.53 GHVT01051822.1:328-654(-)
MASQLGVPAVTRQSSAAIGTGVGGTQRLSRLGQSWLLIFSLFVWFELLARALGFPGWLAAHVSNQKLRLPSKFVLAFSGIESALPEGTSTPLGFGAMQWPAIGERLKG